MSEHMKGAWIIRQRNLAQKWMIFKRNDAVNPIATDICSEEDAARIVACVNACEGLSNEEILGVTLRGNGSISSYIKELESRLYD